MTVDMKNEEKTDSQKEENHPQVVEKRNKYAFACAVIASMVAVMMGYDTGVMSGAMIFIKEDLKVSDTQLSVLAGILNICALVGSPAAGRTSDWIGRRYTIVIASVIFFLGAVLMGIGSSYAVLMIGRCVAGVGVGFSLMIAPVYSAEISSPSQRGFLSSLPEICISIGVLLGYLANYIFSKLPLKLGWRLMLGIGAIPSFFLALSIFAMPESPRWLVMQGRIGDAKKVLLKACNTKEVAETRLRDIKIACGIDENCTDDVVKIPTKTHGEGVLKELLVRPTPTVRRIMIAAIGLHVFQHATGIEAVVLYSPRIFQKAGIESKSNLLIATVCVGITKTCFIFVATLLLDKMGRKPLLLASTAGMFVSLMGLGFGLTMVEHSKEKVMWIIALCVGCVMSYVAFFSIGMGPIIWVYNSEIFPLRLRAQGASIGVAVNRVMNGSLSMAFISIYKAITIGGTFFLFAGMSILAWLFFFFLLPETKGKSLEEIEELFGKTTSSVDLEGGKTEKGGLEMEKKDVSSS